MEILKEERELILEWIHLQDKSPFHCSEVKNSFYSSNSSNLENSQYVHSSTDITNSSTVCFSSFVQDSHQVFKSEFVSSSQRIMLSQNVENSRNIVRGTTIFDSSSIFDSKVILSSREIRNSDNVTDSAFCANCKNIKDCLFCFDLTNQAFQIFNTPIDPTRFAIIKAQYIKLLSEELNFVKEWPDNLLKAITPQITERFDWHYQVLPDKFWRWIKTLPGYDENVLHQITLLPQFLSQS